MLPPRIGSPSIIWFHSRTDSQVEYLPFAAAADGRILPATGIRRLDPDWYYYNPVLPDFQPERQLGNDSQQAFISSISF